jgi:beta-barrel assembly-enhancing protease
MTPPRWRLPLTSILLTGVVCVWNGAASQAEDPPSTGTAKGAGKADPEPVRTDAPKNDPEKAAQTKKKATSKAVGSARGRNAAARVPKRGADEPPPCPHKTIDRPKRPAPRSMPEMFTRMGESFARNPANGFQTFVQELSELEGPAMEGITLTPAEERQAGQRVRAEYLAQANQHGYKVVNDPARLKYLRDLVDTIAVRMRNRNRYPTIDITLIDAPISDGQTFPGGYMVFSTALLEEPDEATVIAVVAHELAHLDRGHMYELARRGKLAETTFARPPGVASSFDQFFTRGMALFGLMMNPFRPEQETEADCTATTWMYQEGYDPRGLVGFFERLHRRTNDRPPDAFFSFGRTHPFSLDRRREVLDRLAQLQRWKARDDLGLFPENLHKLIARKTERAAAD